MVPQKGTTIGKTISKAKKPTSSKERKGSNTMPFCMQLQRCTRIGLFILYSAEGSPIKKASVSYDVFEASANCKY